MPLLAGVCPGMETPSSSFQGADPRSTGMASHPSDSLGAVPPSPDDISVEWEVRIARNGAVLLDPDFVGPFLADRLAWERDRRKPAAPPQVEPSAPPPPPAPAAAPAGPHATVAEFAHLIRLSVRTTRELVKTMTEGRHYFRQGRRVVIIVDAARHLIESRNLLDAPSTGDLAEDELARRSQKLASRPGGRGWRS